MVSFPREENRVPVIGGVSSIDSTTPVPIGADPTTKRLLVDASITDPTTGASASVTPHGTDEALVVHTPDMTMSGSLGSLNATVEIELHGMGSCLVQVSGTWSGKIEFQGAIDGVWNTLSIFQPTGAITRNGIQNDNQNGLYRIVIIPAYTKARAIMTSYTSGSASILFNASVPVGSSQVWQLNPSNLLANSQIVTGSTVATVEARKQTPTGNALNVQIGPGDVISNIPVVMDFQNHQVHEGVVQHAIDQQLSLNASTVKYGITVATYNPTIQSPHFTMEIDSFDGWARVDIYEGATFTGGSLLTKNNKNRNSSNTDATTITGGVTSTNGTLIDSFFVGGGVKAVGRQGIRDEWVLKSNTIYRIDVIGGVNPTAAIVSFEYYADLGV